MDDLRFNRPIYTPSSKSEAQNKEENKKTGTNEQKPEQKAGRKRFLAAVISMLALFAVIISIGLAFNFYLKAQRLESQMRSGEESEVQKVVTEVGNLMILPKDEDPTVATISDVEKLRGQAFFADAKNGDKVLIYAKAEKAILYDPVQKKIVAVAPLNNAKTGN